MQAFVQLVQSSLPLFLLVFAGWAVMRLLHWPEAASGALTRFVFNVALPAMLFHLMSDLSRLPPVDARLLLAFFGGCLVVFGIGRVVGARVFRMDGTAQSVFALGGVFSNNVLLGLPLARTTLGDAAVPSVALVLVFNALTLWTLVTVSIEWSRHGAFTVQGMAKTVRGVLTNPLVLAILSGSAFGFAGLRLPDLLSDTLGLLSQAAAPTALFALGMGLSAYDVREGWRISAAIAVLKLAVQPLAVWALAWALGLPPLETQVVVLLGSLAVGANVYLMSRQFQTLEGPVAASLVMTTAVSALSTPLVLALVRSATAGP